MVDTYSDMFSDMSPIVKSNESATVSASAVTSYSDLLRQVECNMSKQQEGTSAQAPKSTDSLHAPEVPVSDLPPGTQDVQDVNRVASTKGDEVYSSLMQMMSKTQDMLVDHASVIHVQNETSAKHRILGLLPVVVGMACASYVVIRYLNPRFGPVMSSAAITALAGALTSGHVIKSLVD